MRCESCSKMVSQEPVDVEVDDASYADGELTASVHIAQACAECGGILKEYTFDVQETVDDFHDEKFKGEHVVEVDTQAENADKREGKGRYSKQFYGAKVIFGLSCSCDHTAQVDWEDYIQASSMDEV